MFTAASGRCLVGACSQSVGGSRWGRGGRQAAAAAQATGLSEWSPARSIGTGASEGVAVVPGHPLVGMKASSLGVLEQLGEVVEGVDTFELAGVDDGS